MTTDAPVAQWAGCAAPSLDAFEALARHAVAALPPEFADAARDVALRIDDFADDATLAEMEIDDPFGLTGLYSGVPLTEKSVLDQAGQPDAIWLFRRPILDEWIARGDVALDALIAHVYVHELAHHLGWSDDAIAQIAPWQD